MPAKPLANTKVVDLSAVYAGPICARRLAGWGANLLKVETTGAGGMQRLRQAAVVG
jgi:crotonobetainyl-CoA:carnitine CoA-transferase CaiB-like acyl-CoA transferase